MFPSPRLNSYNHVRPELSPPFALSLSKGDSLLSLISSVRPELVEGRPPYTDTTVSVSPASSAFIYASTRSRVR